MAATIWKRAYNSLRSYPPARTARTARQWGPSARAKPAIAAVSGQIEKVIWLNRGISPIPMFKTTCVFSPIFLLMSGTRCQKRHVADGLRLARVRAATGPSAVPFCGSKGV